MPVVTYIAKSIPVSICCSRVGMHIHAEGGRGAGMGNREGLKQGEWGRGRGGWSVTCYALHVRKESVLHKIRKQIHPSQLCNCCVAMGRYGNHVNEYGRRIQCEFN